MASQHDYLDFTGERIVPELENYFFYEHLARYRLSKSYLSPDTELLDIGCGDGYGVYYLANVVKTATGVDISKDTIACAKKKYIQPNLNYEVISPSQETVLNKKFDCITCFEVFEHIEKPEQLLSQINNSLKNNGTLIISTPNVNVFGDKFKIPFHVKEYTLHEFKDELQKKFQIIEIMGQHHRKKWLKKWNFFISKQAMRFPFFLRIANWHIAKKPRKYLEDGYLDSLDLSENYFSKDRAEHADYFVIICRKI